MIIEFHSVGQTMRDIVAAAAVVAMECKHN